MSSDTEQREGFRWWWGSGTTQRPIRVDQVGGSHYSGDIQHWDIMEMHDVGYLEGNATKYLARWRRKAGVQDLQKALSYLEKMGGRPALRLVPRAALSAWGIACDIDPADLMTISLVIGEGHGRPEDVAKGCATIRNMIAREGDADGPA